MKTPTIKNFGGNVVVTPRYYYRPTTEGEVVAILGRHRAGKIRVVASGHAWSEAIACDDVVIDIDHLNEVSFKEEGGEMYVTAGGGTVLHDLIDTIHRTTDKTLPTYGGIKEQTIAGAISTGTHGSGRSSVSHYIEEIRLAAYDEQGRETRIYTIRGGMELRAARCAVGTMGVILSVTIRLVPTYYVASCVTELSSIKEAKERAGQDVLEQFILLPFSWRLLFFNRRITEGDDFDEKKARANRRYNFWVVDVIMHLFVKKIVWLVRLGLINRLGVLWLYRVFIGDGIRKGKTVVDESDPAITLRHDLFAHLETELFVDVAVLEEVTSLSTDLLDFFAGKKKALSKELRRQLDAVGMLEEVEALEGSYIHHYPLYFRRILPDDTLISMTTDKTRATYSMSFFTYLPPKKRDAFYMMMRVMTTSLARLYQVRPHWGKYNPLTREDIAPLYTNLPAFRRIVRSVDPNGVFQNDYTRRTLGF